MELIREYKENEIKRLQDINYNLRNDIKQFSDIIKKKEKIIDDNIKKIQSICDHEFRLDICYGEKTRHECIKCGYWY